MDCQYFDVIIVGAGLSGIGAACHLREKCPDKSFVILESRNALGGTWDKFRYPGIRSDSDMFTMGFGFKPWKSAKVIADGPSILQYLQETVAENDLEEYIRFHHKVFQAKWDSAGSLWEVETEDSGDK
ncbi:MAG: NAD(P)/FAD-dependent oxidoreductase, partial [Planctomycetales bacterium]